jgi:hypothetical protein
MNLGVYSTCYVDFGEDDLQFVANFENYRNTGAPRVDDVEVTVDGKVQPAQLICFFKQLPVEASGPHSINSSSAYSSNDIFTLVRYYNVVGRRSHPCMTKSTVKLSDGESTHDFHVVPQSSIRGHAYLVPHFDDVSNAFYFWDKVWDD